MAWHLEAVGSGGVRGTGDKKTMKLAAELYEKVVDNFKAGEFSKFEFPRIVKEDWPTSSRSSTPWPISSTSRRTGPSAARPSTRSSPRTRRPPTPPRPRTRRCSATRTSTRRPTRTASDKKGTGNLPVGGRKDPTRRAQAGSDKEKYAPKEFTDNQKGMVTAFNRYICYIKPAANDKEAQEQYVEVKYARARTYFEAQHWEEAALGFRDVAMNHADNEVGIYATQLYLESLNILGTHSDPPRPSCLRRHGHGRAEVHRALLQRRKEKDNAEQCGILIKIQRDIERLGPRRWSRPPQGRRRLARSSTRRPRTLLRPVEEVRRGRVRGQGPACERSDEILYNAARAFQAASPDREGDRGPRRSSSTRTTASTRPIWPEGRLRDRRQLPGDRRLRRSGRTGTSVRRENPKMEKAPRPSRTPSSSASASVRRTRPSRTPSFSRRTTAPSPAQTARSRSPSAPTTSTARTGTRLASASPAPSARSTRTRPSTCRSRRTRCSASSTPRRNKRLERGTEYNKVRGSGRTRSAAMKKLDAHRRR
jgi:hypothetical protein